MEQSQKQKKSNYRHSLPILQQTKSDQWPPSQLLCRLQQLRRLLEEPLCKMNKNAVHIKSKLSTDNETNMYMQQITWLGIATTASCFLKHIQVLRLCLSKIAWKTNAEIEMKSNCQCMTKSTVEFFPVAVVQQRDIHGLQVLCGNPGFFV